MSWFRFSAALAGLFLLAACGFTPMHAGKDLSATYAAITIDNIPDRDGQFLRNLMIDRLYTQGRPANPRWRLAFSPLKERVTKMGIKKDATSTRSFIQLDTLLTLKGADGKTLLERPLRVVGSYDILREQYANVVGEQTSRENLLRELADNAVNEINLYLNRS